MTRKAKRRTERGAAEPAAGWKGNPSWQSVGLGASPMTSTGKEREWTGLAGAVGGSDVEVAGGRCCGLGGPRPGVLEPSELVEMRTSWVIQIVSDPGQRPPSTLR